MPRYRNPYDFVPLEKKADCFEKPSLASAGGLSGRITYELTTLTPLCIHQDPGKAVRHGGRDLYQFAYLGNQPRIPATSLKGMLRAVHEALTNSTMGLLNTRAWYIDRVPEHYRPGGPNLTASEALFGMVGASKQHPDGCAGRLFIDDIVISNKSVLGSEHVSRPAGGQPKPAHTSFYFRPDGDRYILGRKFYYHQQDYNQTLDVYRQRRMPEIEVETIRSRTSLEGCLRFVGLSEAELDSLIYALILEDGTAHKLGYGKPLGLGSVRITIKHLELEPLVNNVPVRFRSYGTPTLEHRNEEIVVRRDRAQALWHNRSGGGAASHAAFVAIACWPQTENFVYPDFSYFRSQRGRSAQEPLWEYQGRSAKAYYPGGSKPVDSATTGSASTSEGTSARTSQLSMPPAPRERRRGRFARRSQVGMSVQDELDERIYQARPTNAASRKMLRRLVDLLDDHGPPMVSFHIEIDTDLEGKQVYVAIDLQLEGAD